MALQDPSSERHARAKYLGYLLRSGGVQTLDMRDQYLTTQDLDHMLAVYNARTTQERLRALYERAWHGRKTRTLDDKSAQKFVGNASEVIGVMHETADPAETVDVFLAGYGQCGVKRALLPADLASRATENDDKDDKTARHLTSLDLLFLNGRETVPSIVRLLTGGVGRALDKLQLEIEDGAYSVQQLAAVLEECPALRKFIVKPLRLTRADDTLTFAPPAPRTPLGSLTVELEAAFAESAGLAGACRLLGAYTAELEEFLLLADQRVVADRAYVAAVDELLSQRMPQLRKLRVVGFTSGYLRSLWNSRRREGDGLSGLRVLMLESVMWDERDWTQFVAALADNAHPLAQSVHTLHLKLTGWEDLDALQAALAANARLLNVAIDVNQGVNDRAAFTERARSSHGRHVGFVAQPLSVRHRAAFLSAVAEKTPAAPLETAIATTIFEYAAGTETRCVPVHLVTAQPPPLF